MKKFIILLLLLFISQSSFAQTQWRELAYKTYYDENSIIRDGNEVTVWLKILKGSQLDFYKPLKTNPNYWYNKTQITVDCHYRTVAHNVLYAYDLKNNPININDPFTTYRIVTGHNLIEEIPPDSIGADIVDKFCAEEDEEVEEVDNTDNIIKWEDDNC